MINLKKILSKITEQIKYLSNNDMTIKFAQRTWTTDTNKTDYQVWHKLSDFNITANTTLTNDSSYFTSTTDGIKVKKAGRYYVKITGHGSCVSAANYLVRVAIRILKVTENTVPGYGQFFWDGDQRNGFYYEWSGTFGANANEEIRMQMYKYWPNNTSYGYRPSYTTMEILYLGPA